MGLGRLNPGCICDCKCNESEVPAFSGWQALDNGWSSSFDRFFILGAIEWTGGSVGTLRNYKDGVLVGTQVLQPSPKVIALQSANNGGQDGLYEFVLENKCGSTSAVCSICSMAGLVIQYPPPDGLIVGSQYVQVYPGDCVNLCSYIPEWRLQSEVTSYSFRYARHNPYSCIDCLDLPDFNSIREWPDD